jgi:hypothetical protein
VLEHVSFWKLNANGKDTNRKDDPCDLEGDEVSSIIVPPGPRVKDPGPIWT